MSEVQVDSGQLPLLPLAARVEALVDAAQAPSDSSTFSLLGAVKSGTWFLSFFCTATMTFLLAWVVMPIFVADWTSTAVESGSMTPSIQRGDVITFRPPADTPYEDGVVVLFQLDGEQTVHRVVAADHDERVYWTRGDANATVDTAPVPFDAVLGAGALLVPLVGHPVLWLNEGRYLYLLLLAAGIGSAIWPTIAHRSVNETQRAKTFQSVVVLALETDGEQGALFPHRSQIGASPLSSTLSP